MYTNKINPNNVNYEAINQLSKNIDNELFSNLFTNINICAYQILNKEKNPFLQFLLYNDTNNTTLSFPSIDILTIAQIIDISNTQKLLDYIPCFFTPFRIEDAQSNVSNPPSAPERGLLNEKLCKTLINKLDILMGFHLDTKSKTIFVFYDFTNCNLCLDLFYSNSKFCLALVDEIINKQHVCNIKIHNNTSNFFLLNQQFISLTNKNGEKIEHPVACYVGKELNEVSFTYFLGLSKIDTEDAILGPYYYFTNFKNALHVVKGGIIRFAVFLGKMLVKLNYPEDSIDNSAIKREKITGSNHNEQLTMRITDYDGLWSRKYDSCFIGNIKLDNGDILNYGPIFVVKNYEQYYPLSYHFTNNNNTGIK
jgi:hypothetical protein